MKWTFLYNKKLIIIKNKIVQNFLNKFMINDVIKKKILKTIKWKKLFNNRNYLLLYTI